MPFCDLSVAIGILQDAKADFAKLCFWRELLPEYPGRGLLGCCEFHGEENMVNIYSSRKIPQKSLRAVGRETTLIIFRAIREWEYGCRISGFSEVGMTRWCTFSTLLYISLRGDAGRQPTTGKCENATLSEKPGKTQKHEARSPLKTKKVWKPRAGYCWSRAYKSFFAGCGEYCALRHISAFFHFAGKAKANMRILSHIMCIYSRSMKKVYTKKRSSGVKIVYKHWQNGDRVVSYIIVKMRPDALKIGTGNEFCKNCKSRFKMR